MRLRDHLVHAARDLVHNKVASATIAGIVATSVLLLCVMVALRRGLDRRIDAETEGNPRVLRALVYLDRAELSDASNQLAAAEVADLEANPDIVKVVPFEVESGRVQLAGGAKTEVHVRSTLGGDPDLPRDALLPSGAAMDFSGERAECVITASFAESLHKSYRLSPEQLAALAGSAFPAVFVRKQDGATVPVEVRFRIAGVIPDGACGDPGHSVFAPLEVIRRLSLWKTGVLDALPFSEEGESEYRGVTARAVSGYDACRLYVTPERSKTFAEPSMRLEEHGLKVARLRLAIEAEVAAAVVDRSAGDGRSWLPCAATIDGREATAIGTDLDAELLSALRGYEFGESRDDDRAGLVPAFVDARLAAALGDDRRVRVVCSRGREKASVDLFAAGMIPEEVPGDVYLPLKIVREITAWREGLLFRSAGGSFTALDPASRSLLIRIAEESRARLEARLRAAGVRHECLTPVPVTVAVRSRSPRRLQEAFEHEKAAYVRLALAPVTLSQPVHAVLALHRVHGRAGPVLRSLVGRAGLGAAGSVFLDLGVARSLGATEREALTCRGPARDEDGEESHAEELDLAVAGFADLRPFPFLGDGLVFDGGHDRSTRERAQAAARSCRAFLLGLPGSSGRSASRLRVWFQDLSSLAMVQDLPPARESDGGLALVTLPSIEGDRSRELAELLASVERRGGSWIGLEPWSSVIACVEEKRLRAAWPAGRSKRALPPWLSERLSDLGPDEIGVTPGVGVLPDLGLDDAELTLTFTGGSVFAPGVVRTVHPIPGADSTVLLPAGFLPSGALPPEAASDETCFLVHLGDSRGLERLCAAVGIADYELVHDPTRHSGSAVYLVPAPLDAASARKALAGLDLVAVAEVLLHESVHGGESTRFIAPGAAGLATLLGPAATERVDLRVGGAAVPFSGARRFPDAEPNCVVLENADSLETFVRLERGLLVVDDGGRLVDRASPLALSFDRERCRFAAQPVRIGRERRLECLEITSSEDAGIRPQLASELTSPAEVTVVPSVIEAGEAAIGGEARRIILRGSPALDGGRVEDPLLDAVLPFHYPHAGSLEEGRRSLVLGAELARELGVAAAAVSPRSRPELDLSFRRERAGGVETLLLRFQVVGVMREADGLPAACFALAANAVLHDLKLWRRGDLDYSPYYGAFQANREKAQLQEPRVEKFVAHVRSIDDLEAAVAFLRERLEPRGFRVESSRSLVDFYLRLRTALAVVCLFIVVVPFLVCAATIFLAFNSMVNNRRQEIGILQALGLKSVSILAIYLLEAGMLGAAGGVVGLAGGLAVLGPVDALLGSQLGIDANEGLLDFGAGNAAFSLAVAVVVSLLGALVPAVKAARNDPICSLSAP